MTIHFRIIEAADHQFLIEKFLQEDEGNLVPAILVQYYHREVYHPHEFYFKELSDRDYVFLNFDEEDCVDLFSSIQN